MLRVELKGVTCGGDGVVEMTEGMTEYDTAEWDNERDGRRW